VRRFFLVLVEIVAIDVFLAHDDGSKFEKLGGDLVPALIGPLELHQRMAVAVDGDHAAGQVGQPRQFRPAGVHHHPFSGVLLSELFQIFGQHRMLRRKSRRILGQCSTLLG